MKVCTDSCLFGAWIADKIKNYNYDFILDVGTGTGLLALMMAQQIKINIHAVEIELQAYEQARENFATSPWPDQLTAFHSDIFTFFSSVKYDLIVCNPPFYRQSLLGSNQPKNIALHQVQWSFESFFELSYAHSTQQGVVAMMIPYDHVADIINMAIEKKLYLNEIVNVKQSPKHTCFRCFLFFSKTKGATMQKEITIRKNKNDYSEAFISLMKDYYL